MTGTSNKSMDEPLSPLARIVLLSAGALAIIAGPVLYLLPEHTAVYFAWHIKHPLTPVFMGASYLAGIGNFVAVKVNRWALARVQVPAIIVFAVMMLVATVLHIPIFNWSHPIAWAWLAVYIVSPLAATTIFLRAEWDYRPPVQTGNRLPTFFGPAMVALATLDALIGTALFLLPQQAAPLWPWSLTPLTARVIGGWYLGGGALKGMLAGQRTLATAWVGLLASSVTAGLLLIGALWHWVDFDGPVPAVSLYLLTLVINGTISIHAWWRATRPAPVPQA